MEGTRRVPATARMKIGHMASQSISVEGCNKQSKSTLQLQQPSRHKLAQSRNTTILESTLTDKEIPSTFRLQLKESKAKIDKNDKLEVKTKLEEKGRHEELKALVMRGSTFRYSSMFVPRFTLNYRTAGRTTHDL